MQGDQGVEKLQPTLAEEIQIIIEELQFGSGELGTEDQRKGTTDAYQRQSHQCILNADHLVIERDVDEFFPATVMLFMVLGCIDPASPLHPVTGDAGAEEEGNGTDETAQHPGRLSKEKLVEQHYFTEFLWK
jgi:hypothetical protein